MKIPSKRSSFADLITRKISNPRARSHPAVLFLASIGLAFAGMQPVTAFTAADATLAWNCWNNTFYFTISSPSSADYWSQEGSTNTPSFWHYAEDLEIAEDRGDVARVNLLCAGFLAKNGTDWSGNTYNDDLMWASIAFSRAYQLTGNTSYRTDAKNGFDLAYSRGWDTAGGGGFFQNTAKNSKPSITDGAGCIAAFLLYQTLADSSYKTKAQAIHSWEQANCYDAATGAVREGPPSTPTYFTYDSGTFAAGAWLLGDTATATNAGDWVQNNWGVTMQHFGQGADAGGFNGICMRWLAKSGYDSTFLRAVCDNAWSMRNSAGLTDQAWYVKTNDTDALYSFDCGSMVAAMLCVPPPIEEAENLSVPQYSGPDYRVLTETGLSGGAAIILDSTAVGNEITFLVPNIAAGTYDVRVGVKKANTRGIWQLSIGTASNFSGTKSNVGSAHDDYSSAAQYVQLDLGTWTAGTSSDKWFCFTIKGKNASSGGSTECIDYIELISQ
jgi:hypothetical protein